MSNPTTAVFPLIGDYDGVGPSGAIALTPSGPQRFLDGAWFEQATKNFVRDPIGQDVSEWFPAADVNLTANVALPAPLPDEVAALGVTTCFQLSTTANKNTGALVSAGLATLDSAVAHSISILVYIPTGNTMPGLELRNGLFTGASGVTNNTANVALKDQWQWVESAFTPDAGDLAGTLVLWNTVSQWLTGQSFYFVCPQVEPGMVRTSFTPKRSGTGTDWALSSGYAWTSTAYNSASTRAASSASVTTAGNIDSTIGSLAFRFTRKIDTAGIEYLLICGTDGDDRLRIYVNTDDTLHVAWDTGSALPQEVASLGTIAVNTEYFVYTYWDETIIGLSIDNGETVVGVRDVPLGSWGTDPLTLQAT